MTIPFGFPQHQLLARSSGVAAPLDYSTFTKTIGSFVHDNPLVTVTRVGGTNKILYCFPYSATAYYEVDIPVGAVNFGKVIASNGDGTIAFSNGVDTVWVYTWDQSSLPVLATTLTQTGNGNFGASLHLTAATLFVGNTNASGGGRVLSYSLLDFSSSTTYTPTISDSAFGNKVSTDGGSRLCVIGGSKLSFYTVGSSSVLGTEAPGGGATLDSVLFYDSNLGCFCVADSGYLRKYDWDSRSNIESIDLATLGATTTSGFTDGLVFYGYYILYSTVSGDITNCDTSLPIAETTNTPGLVMVAANNNAGTMCCTSGYSAAISDPYGNNALFHPLTLGAPTIVYYRYSAQSLSAFSPGLSVFTDGAGATNITPNYTDWYFSVWGASSPATIAFPKPYIDVSANRYMTHLVARTSDNFMDVYSMQTRSVIHSVGIPNTLNSLQKLYVSDSGDKVIVMAMSTVHSRWVFTVFDMIAGTSSAYVPPSAYYSLRGASPDLSLFVISSSSSPKDTKLIRSSDFAVLCTVPYFCYYVSVSPYAATGISWDAGLTTARVINLFTGTYVDHTVPSGYFDTSVISEDQQYALLGPTDTPHLIRISDWTTTISYPHVIGYPSDGRYMSTTKFFSNAVNGSNTSAISW